MIQARRSRKQAVTVDDVFAIFAPGQGRSVTLGVNFPAAIAAQLRRIGNRGRSVSDALIGCLDPEKLAELLTSEQKRIDSIAGN